MTVLFKGKVICGYCAKKHRFKKERSKINYTCSLNDRNSSNCRRNKVSQQEILELLELRKKRLLTKEEIDELVKYIKVTEDKIEIKLYNEDDIILSTTYAKF